MSSLLHSLSIIIPCFNEIDTLEEVVLRIHATNLNIDYEIVVVDDSSTDDSGSLIKRMFAEKIVDKFVIHEKNRGKGAAIRTGVECSSGSIILIQDADLEYSPSDYPKLLKPILEGSAQVVYGSRFISQNSQNKSPFHRAVANKFLTKLSNFFTGLNLTDMETCYKVFLKQSLNFHMFKENRFGFEPEFTALVALHRLQIVEIPISYSPRTKLEGKKIGFKDGLRAIWVIVLLGIWKYKKV